STPVQGGALTELLPIDMGPQDSFREVIASGNMLYLSAADGGLQLFSVAIGGGEQIALSDKYSFDVDLFFAFSPDGKTVMYEVRDVSAPRDSITFIVPVLGGESVQIDQGLSSTSKSCGTEFTPDSSKLIFCRADSATSDGRLSIADIASPTSRARLNNGQIVAGTSRGFRVTPDGKWLLVSSIEAIAAVFDHRLVRVPTSPGLKQQVFSFRSSSSRRICNGIDYSLDSSIISYCDIAPETGRARVIAQSTEQGEPRVLDPNPLGIGVIFHTISRDGEKVVILKDLESQGFQLFSAPTSLFEGQICLPIATKKEAFR
ncbi:MAG: WD40 repeat protein, partial [Arenicella sp.]